MLHGFMVGAVSGIGGYGINKTTKSNTIKLISTSALSGTKDGKFSIESYLHTAYIYLNHIFLDEENLIFFVYYHFDNGM